MWHPSTLGIRSPNGPLRRAISACKCRPGANQLFDPKKIARSKNHCDVLAGVAENNCIEIRELSTHLPGQFVAVHLAYGHAFDGFAAPEVRNNLKGSRYLGIEAHVTFSGGARLADLYPRLQRPAGLVKTAFDELARRWMPTDKASTFATRSPRKDLYNSVTLEMFLEPVKSRPRANMRPEPFPSIAR